MDSSIKSKTKLILLKSTKVLAYVLLGVFLFVYLLIAVLNSSLVQSYTAAKVSEYFSKEWKAKVSIGALEIRPLLTVGLKDVYLEDPKGNVIADADYISASLRSFTLPNEFVLSEVYLRNVNYVVAIGEEGLNLSFIINYFKSDKPKPPKPKGPPFTLRVDKLKMDNVDFKLDLNTNPTPIPDFGVAINHMQFDDINAIIKDIVVINDSIRADFQRFSTRERSGQTIKDLSGKFVVSPRGITCRDMHLQTDDSDLRMQAGIKTSSWKTYSYFIDSADCNLLIAKGSRVSVKDATYWAPMLKGFDQTFSIFTKIEGTVANAKCEFMELETSQTKLSLEGSVCGLPDIYNTVFDVRLKHLESSVEDFNSFRFGEMLSSVKLPQMLATLGTVKMEADFSGYIDKFIASGKIETGVGDFDLLANSDRVQGGKTYYECSLKSPKFDVGAFLNQKILSTTAVELTANAIPGGLNELIAEAEVQLDGLVFNGNNYNSVFLDAKMDKGKVDAQCDILDDALVLNLNCKGNIADTQMVVLSADISEADLNKMNFYVFSDPETEVSTRIFARVRDFDLGSMNGFVDLQNTKISNTEKEYEIEYFNLRLKNDSLENRLMLKSDLADLTVNGKYQLPILIKEVTGLIDRYKPDLYLLSDSEITSRMSDTLNQSFDVTSSLDFDLNVKNISLIAQLFDLDMGLENGLSLKGKINPQDIFAAELSVPSFAFNDMMFEQIEMMASTNKKGLSLFAGLENLQLTDSFAISTPKVNIDLEGNDVRLLANFGNKEQNDIGGKLDVRSYLTNTGLQVTFSDSYISLAGDKIRFNDNHLINYKNGCLSLMNFALYKGKENIVVNGDMSSRSEDKLTVTFKNLDIADFNPILQKFGLSLQGKMNDNVVLRSVFKDMTLTSNVTIDDLVINDVKLGKAKFGFNNMLSKNEFAADIRMSYNEPNSGQIIPLSIKGRVNLADKNDNLDLKVDMQEFDIRIIENYLSSLSSYVRGKISAENLLVKGKFTQPHIAGSLKIKDGAMKIDMLNTTYSFDDELFVNDNIFTMDNFVLQDAQKNKITINGTITHDNFTNFDLNLKAKADKIKVLDTEESVDQMYYGTVYASADVNLHGDLNFLNIEVTAKTERGTNLTVPISSKMSANENSYIKFASNSVVEEKKSSVKSSQEESSLGYKVVVDLNVNPNAQLSIPMNFNQLKGELAASGNGDLRIDVSSESDLSILGTIEIDNGLFKMSVMDMVTKSFDIEKGGTLAWSGAPSNGELNVEAVYKTKASLAPVLGQDFSKAVDVHSVIKLTGNMMNPQPKFDIRLPNTDANTVERLFMNIDRNDERAMLEQTASLLFFHQFYSSEGASENLVIETGLSSAFEAAFGQISGMLTDLIQVVDVNMNYSRGADGMSDRVDFNLSKDYGRIVVNANAGFSGRNEMNMNENEAIIGDAYVEYKMTENFRVRVFNRSNANDFTKYNIAPYTQGVGLFYHRQYDSFKDMFTRKKKNK